MIFEIFVSRFLNSSKVLGSGGRCIPCPFVTRSCTSRPPEIERGSRAMSLEGLYAISLFLFLLVVHNDN